MMRGRVVSCDPVVRLVLGGGESIGGTVLHRQKPTVLVVLLVLALAVLGCVAWWNQTGCFSAVNFGRIAKGMDLGEVQALLGSSGEEISFSEIPGVRPADKLPESPDGWLGVVWGERCFRWNGGHRQILVGFSAGRVVCKYLVDYGL
jgi:hypothetical protein